MTPQPNSGVGHYVVEVSGSHNYTRARARALGLLWTSDQLVAEVAAWQHGKHYRRTSLLEIGTRNPTSRAAADLRLWPHGHRDRQVVMFASSYPSSWNRPTPSGLIFTTNFRHIPIWLRSDKNNGNYIPVFPRTICCRLLSADRSL